jgi:hypothetical protein
MASTNNNASDNSVPTSDNGQQKGTIVSIRISDTDYPLIKSMADDLHKNGGLKN